MGVKPTSGEAGKATVAAEPDVMVVGTAAVEEISGEAGRTVMGTLGSAAAVVGAAGVRETSREAATAIGATAVKRAGSSVSGSGA